MQLACNTLLFGNWPLETALAHVAIAGFTRVELSAGKNMGEHVSPEFTPARIEEVRRLLADHGLEAVAMEAGGPDRERLERLLPIAADLGIPVVTIGSGGVDGDEASFGEAVETIGGLARLAEAAGVRLAVKVHVGKAVFDTPTALRLMDEVREPALGLNFDPSHLYRANEEPHDIVRRWGAALIAVHFRDCASRDQRVGPPQTQIPGRGRIDVPATLRALHEIGISGPLTVQTVGAQAWEPVRAVAIAAESRGYLHRCYQELGIVG